MKIDSIASQPDRAGKHTVRFSDGSRMRLYRQTIEDFGLYTDLELSDTQMASLRTAASAMSAKMRALRIVAATSVSKGDLERRLIHKGEDPKQAKEAVQWMEDLQLVDDLKTAQQIVQRCISKGYGLSRAKQALYEKRIPRQYWEEALEDYPDQTEAISAFLQNRLGNSCDDRDLRRCIDALIRRGHSYGQIRRCLEQMSLDVDDILEE